MLTCFLLINHKVVLYGSEVEGLWRKVERKAGVSRIGLELICISKCSSGDLRKDQKVCGCLPDNPISGSIRNFNEN